MRRVSRTHRFDLDRLYDRINLEPMILITHINTTLQVADILTKGSFTGDRWTQLTLLVKSMTRTTFTPSNSSMSAAVVNPSLVQHE